MQSSKLKSIAKPVRDFSRDVKNRLKIPSSILSAKRQGNIIKRMEGLELLLDNAKAKNVLDIGCYDGLIAYEFARRGANTVLGLDNDQYHLNTAKRIFSQMEMDSKFVHVDLRNDDLGELVNGTSDKNKEFGIVLFLGVFQHIHSNMSEEEKQKLVDDICSSCKGFLAVRMPDHTWPAFDKYFWKEGFELICNQDQIDTVGALRLYKVVSHD